MSKQARQGISIEENTKLKTKGRWLLYVDNEIIVESSRKETVQYIADQMRKRLSEK